MNPEENAAALSEAAESVVEDFIAHFNLNYFNASVVKFVTLAAVESDELYIDHLETAKLFIDREIQRIHDNATRY